MENNRSPVSTSDQQAMFASASPMPPPPTVTTPQNPHDLYPLPPAPQIDTTTKAQDVFITHPVNHNEISIMENDWDMIREKVNAIQIGGSIDLRNLILGALIPCLLSLFSDPDWLSVAVCGLAYIVFFEIHRIPYFKRFKFYSWITDRTPENCVHLQDIQDIITRIEHKRSSSLNREAK